MKFGGEDSSKVKKTIGSVLRLIQVALAARKYQDLSRRWSRDRRPGVNTERHLAGHQSNRRIICWSESPAPQSQGNPVRMFSLQPTRRLCHEPAQAPMSHGSTERGPRSAVLIQVSQRNDWRQQAGRLSSDLLSAGHVPTVNECYGELLTQKTTQAFVFCPMKFLTSRTAVACDFA